jgi:hypothetical protein
VGGDEGRKGEKNIGRVLRNEKTDFTYADYSEQNSITSLKISVLGNAVVTTQYLT